MVKLLLILDNEQLGEQYIQAAIKGAPYCDMIWFRIKNDVDNIIYEKAKALRNAVKTPLILSERADIAYMAGFEGVHLNKDSLPVAAVRASFPEMIIGYSAHNEEECEQPEADYVTLSPIFFTQKSYPVTPIGAIPAPNDKTIALGGICIDNVKELKNLGYMGVAGISLYKDLEKIYKIIK